MVRRWSGSLLVVLALLALGATAAQADTGNIIEPQHQPPTNKDGWQAGTCLTDEPVSAEPEVHCGPQTGAAFFKQAGGHPPIGFTQYIIQHETPKPLEPPYPPGSVAAPIKEPLANHEIKTLRVDLPPGLTVNPNATPEKCSLAEFLFSPATGQFAPKCSPATKVGEEEVTLVTNEEGAEVPGIGPIGEKGFVIPPTAGLTKISVYNLQPKPGEPALFGFVVAGKEPVFLETAVSWEGDFHESFTIRLPEAEVPGLSTLISRLINFGATTGNGTYINNPTTCFNPNLYPHLYSTWFRAESYGEPDPNFPAGSTPVEAKVAENAGGVEKLVQQEGCGQVPFTPGLEVNPGTNQIDSPSPAAVNTTLRYLTGTESKIQESHLRRAVVTLPRGMGLNPSGSQGLVACTDAEFRKGQRTYDNACPPASAIGSAEIESPPLAEKLIGTVYVGEQKSSDPTSGEEFRILVEAKEEQEGVGVRLVGHVSANPATGQLTATFNEQQVGSLAGRLPAGLPQVPFTSVRLSFNGSKSVLTSPPTCAAAETSGAMEPWARPNTTVPVSAKFTLSSVPGGGSCPQTLAQRPFAPGFAAAPDHNRAGAYSPFRVQIARADGQQELKVVDVTLPEGLEGKLAGIPYCSDQAIAAAAAISGKGELANPSCPGASWLGHVSTVAGSGRAPLTLPGNAYLAGPYKGAPLSLATITPAVSGPFDLGDVVVRVALDVNPETAQVEAISDPIPDVYGGVKLDVRSIIVNMERSRFMLNPTNCQAKSTAAILRGGGADPANPASWSAFSTSAPFQAVGCRKLRFKPRFYVRISGPTRRAKNPRIRAILVPRRGNANVARTALNLPHSLFLDQGHIRTICTRVQLAAQQCPKAAVYGNARARSPLLDKVLKGPVYLVSSKHPLPDLVADLRGQINIQLHGVISSKHGGLKTVFPATPDVPVSKFILNMQGGHKSLLQNSSNLCARPQRAVLNIKAQNSRRFKSNRYRLNVKACHKKRGKRR